LLAYPHVCSLWYKGNGRWEKGLPSPWPQLYTHFSSSFITALAQTTSQTEEASP
jgi:hypothetical protein